MAGVIALVGELSAAGAVGGCRASPEFESAEFTVEAAQAQAPVGGTIQVRLTNLESEALEYSRCVRYDRRPREDWTEVALRRPYGYCITVPYAVASGATVSFDVPIPASFLLGTYRVRVQALTLGGRTVRGPMRASGKFAVVAP